MNLDQLHPGKVWHYFKKISAIPRCSGNEGEIRNWLIEFADKKGFTWKKDEAGNLCIKKPAVRGAENSPAVILQGHLDMVCVKDEGSCHDFDKDPVKLVLNGDLLSADGTTLGADNGVGSAMIVAVLDSDDIQHGPVDALFTVEEETGLIGATALDKDITSGKVLINLDTEEEGELYIGCAGGKIQDAEIDLRFDSSLSGEAGLSILVNGFHGGHSGMEINKGYGNAILFGLEIADLLTRDYGYLLSSLDAPGKHNAIPRRILIEGVLPKKNAAEAELEAAKLAEKIIRDIKDIEPDAVIEIKKTAASAKHFSAELSSKIISTLSSLPSGVLEMRRDVPTLVNTSANFAIVEQKGNKLFVNCSQRSFSDRARDSVYRKMLHILENGGFTVSCYTAYPAWTPNTNSPLLEMCKKIWKDKTGKDAEVKAVHAGLECGVIGERIGNLDMISIGPDMAKVHTPSECLSVSSTGRVWDYFVQILNSLAIEK